MKFMSVLLDLIFLALVTVITLVIITYQNGESMTVKTDTFDTVMEVRKGIVVISDANTTNEIIKEFENKK